MTLVQTSSGMSLVQFSSFFWLHTAQGPYRSEGTVQRYLIDYPESTHRQVSCISYLHFKVVSSPYLANLWSDHSLNQNKCLLEELQFVCPVTGNPGTQDDGKYGQGNTFIQILAHWS